MTKTKSVRVGEELVTREQVHKMLNLYHYLHHTPWYVKLWRKWRAR